jgi:hypothetical protein
MPWPTRLPAFYDEYDPGWASYNRKLIDRYGSKEWEGLLSSLRKSQGAVVEAFAGLTAEDMAAARGPRWRGREISLHSVLRAAVKGETEHLRQVRSFVASSGV